MSEEVASGIFLAGLKAPAYLRRFGQRCVVWLLGGKQGVYIYMNIQSIHTHICIYRYIHSYISRRIDHVPDCVRGDLVIATLSRQAALLPSLHKQSLPPPLWISVCRPTPSFHMQVASFQGLLAVGFQMAQIESH